MKKNIKKVATEYNKGNFGEIYTGTLMNPIWAQLNYYNGDIAIYEYEYGRLIKKVYSFDKDLNLTEIRDESYGKGKYIISKFKDNKMVEHIDYRFR